MKGEKSLPTFASTSNREERGKGKTESKSG